MARVRLVIFDAEVLQPTWYFSWNECLKLQWIWKPPYIFCTFKPQWKIFHSQTHWRKTFETDVEISWTLSLKFPKSIGTPLFLQSFHFTLSTEEFPVDVAKIFHLLGDCYVHSSTSFSSIKHFTRCWSFRDMYLEKSTRISSNVSFSSCFGIICPFKAGP